MITYTIPPREKHLWIDTPPPEKDPKLGIGKHAAWQTPLHKQAAKTALNQLQK